MFNLDPRATSEVAEFLDYSSPINSSSSKQETPQDRWLKKVKALEAQLKAVGLPWYEVVGCYLDPEKGVGRGCAFLQVFTSTPLYKWLSP